jgi:hypothetical protein
MPRQRKPRPDPNEIPLSEVRVFLLPDGNTVYYHGDDGEPLLDPAAKAALPLNQQRGEEYPALHAKWALDRKRLAELESRLVPGPGKRGRPGYPIPVLLFALDLRRANPHMKAMAIRRQCTEKFGEDSVPDDIGAFRKWMRRGQARLTK